MIAFVSSTGLISHVEPSQPAGVEAPRRSRVPASRQPLSGPRRKPLNPVIARGFIAHTEQM